MSAPAERDGEMEGPRGVDSLLGVAVYVEQLLNEPPLYAASSEIEE